MRSVQSLEMQLKVVNQRGQEPLHKEAEVATPLETATKQRMKTVTENTSLCVIVICKLLCI
jgi:hypothetical protein